MKHYTEVAKSLVDFKFSTKLSERQVAAELDLSKSQVHRLLQIGRIPTEVLDAARRHGTERYVLLEWNKLEDPIVRDWIKMCIISGIISTRKKLKETLDQL